MLFQSTRWPDEMHVALVTLDAPIDRMPKGHVYFDSHVEWFTIEDNLHTLLD